MASAKAFLPLVAFLAVGACGGSNPFSEDEETPPADPNGPVVLYEADDGSGGGYVASVRYDAGSDTFTVDGLPFDGTDAYTPIAEMGGALGPFAVYESAPTVSDPQSGQPIPQLMHRAIYGVSNSGETEFAIVRTGDYDDFGFGGFVYARNNAVTLPTTGQATYAGAYAGLRIFEGRAGLEYTTGEMTMNIDFEDFNAGAGVYGAVRERKVFDIDGNEITGDVATAMGLTELPSLLFVVQPGVVGEGAQIEGSIDSRYLDAGGGTVGYEAGTYYAVVAGENAEEVVGIIVVTSQDPRFDGVTAQETGGFILYR